MKSSLFAFTLFLSFSISSFLPKSLFNPKLEKLVYSKVNATNGHVLELEGGDYVALAGAYIPREGEPNYREYLDENLRQRVLNKKVGIKVVLKSRGNKTSYPLMDIVDVFLTENGKPINLNKELLRQGMAFFSWQFFPRYKEYQRLEEEAKKNRVGVWKEKESLKVLYVTKRTWKDLHYPECPKVKNLRGEDRIEYYVEWPVMYGSRGMGDHGCKYCSLIEKEGKGRKAQGAWF